MTDPITRLFLLLALFAISWVAPVAAQDCYDSSILKPTPFMGNNGEVFQLSDGSLWEVKYEYEYRPTKLILGLSTSTRKSKYRFMLSVYKYLKFRIIASTSTSNDSELKGN